MIEIVSGSLMATWICSRAIPSEDISASCRELFSLTPRLKPGVNEIDEPLPNASQTAPCFPIPLNDLRQDRELR